jgi:hypothetical protein
MNVVRILNDLSNDMTELNCYVQQMVAVSSSFSAEYVDLNDERMRLAVLGDSAGYRNLFDAFCTLQALVRDKAAALDDFAANVATKIRDEEISEAVDKCIAVADANETKGNGEKAARAVLEKLAEEMGIHSLYAMVKEIRGE